MYDRIFRNLEVREDLDTGKLSRFQLNAFLAVNMAMDYCVGTARCDMVGLGAGNRASFLLTGWSKLAHEHLARNMTMFPFYFYELSGGSADDDSAFVLRLDVFDFGGE